MVTGVRANFAARRHGGSQLEGGSYSAYGVHNGGGAGRPYAWRMRCEIYLTTSSVATCIRQSLLVYDSEVLSINSLRLWALGGHVTAIPSESLKKRNQSVLLLRLPLSGPCMGFRHASNGPDFDTELSRNVNLLLVP